MGTRSFAAFCVICCVLVYCSFSVLAQTALASLRLDVSTQAGAHLSPSSRAVVASLKEPLAVTLYRTRAGLARQPDVQDRGERVRALLQAYQASARGHIVLRERDPARFSAIEDEALRGGLVPLRESQEESGFYLGIVVRNTLDEALSIGQIAAADEAGLERALTSLILRLDKPDAIAPAVPLRQVAASSLFTETPKVRSLRADLARAEASMAQASALSMRHAARDRLLSVRAALRGALSERSALEARLWLLLVLGHIVILPSGLALASAWVGRRVRANAPRGG